MENANTFYSQHNEDKYLAQIFHHRTTGVAVEVGAYDGVTLSNTLYFEKKGWRTLLIEPIPAMVAKIKQNRKCEVVQCAASSKSGKATFHIAKGADDFELISTLENNHSFQHVISDRKAQVEQIEVTLRTLDDILETAGVQNIDFITIDVEGHELDALKGFTLNRWKPRIVILEDNTLGADIDVPRYMNQNSYVCFHTTHCNYWYAHKGDALATPFKVFEKKMNKTFARFYRHYLPVAIKTVAPLAVVEFLKKMRKQLNLQ